MEGSERGAAVGSDVSGSSWRGSGGVGARSTRKRGSGEGAAWGCAGELGWQQAGEWGHLRHPNVPSRPRCPAAPLGGGTRLTTSPRPRSWQPELWAAVVGKESSLGRESLGLGESVPGGMHRPAWGRASLGLGRASPLGNAPLGLRESIRGALHIPALGRASLSLGESISQHLGTHPLGRASLGLGGATLGFGNSIPWGTHPSALGRASLASGNTSLGESIP